MNRTKTTTIVVHHSVTPQLNDQTKTMGIIKGAHNGVSPYHRVIGFNWVYKDPNEVEVKFHAGNYPVNLESIAVCLAGNFTVDNLNAYQKEQLKKTLEEWMSKYGIPRVKVKLHREVRLKPTACPGNIDQVFISKLLTPSMTCEQQLAEEKQAHKESIERGQVNYTNWQTELDKRKGLEVSLAQEKSDHAESIAEKLKNAAERDEALAKLKLCQESGAEAKLAQIRSIVT